MTLPRPRGGSDVFRLLVNKSWNWAKMPEANWWVSALPWGCPHLAVCRNPPRLGAQNPRICLLLFLGVGCSTLKSWGRSQLPHVEGKGLGTRFSIFFSHSLEISVQKNPSVQPASSSCHPPFLQEESLGGKKGFIYFISYQSSLSELCREGTGLSFTADFGFMLEKLPHKALNTSKTMLD